MDPSFMTYNSGPLWLLILICFWNIINCCRVETEEAVDEEGLIEGLDDYYDALKNYDKATLIGHEEYFSRYGCKTISTEQLAKIKESKFKMDAKEVLDLDKLIQGVGTYRILDNL